MPKFEIDKFVDTVLRMREAQQEYFRTKNKKVMIHAMMLEGAVDTMIKEYKATPPPKPRQPSLFDQME